MPFNRILIFLCLTGLAVSCGDNPVFTKAVLGNEYDRLPASPPQLTAMPIALADLASLHAFGDTGLAHLHNGFDFSISADAPFYSVGDGLVSNVELNTGVGWAGTNYRITIQIAKNVIVDYHFEIAGTVDEATRRANIFVSEGDWVIAGQKIANLLYFQVESHVHFMIAENNNSGTICPLTYFTPQAAAELEAMFDNPAVIKHPATRDNLCE